MILSFGWTAPALRAGAKTVTRRSWDRAYADTFNERHAPGGGDPAVAPERLVRAFDKQPYAGGREFGLLALVQAAEWQLLADLPEADFAAEGFEWWSQHPEIEVPVGLLRVMGVKGPLATVKQWQARVKRSPDRSWRQLWNLWRESGGGLWVVRFRVAEWTRPPAGQETATDRQMIVAG